jgi:hypothetical protein
MDELRCYLEMLLGHDCSSGNTNCPECQRLRRIYQFIETELFSTVIYTETPIRQQQFSPYPSKAANRAARRAPAVRTPPECA